MSMLTGNAELMNRPTIKCAPWVHRVHIRPYGQKRISRNMCALHVYTNVYTHVHIYPYTYAYTYAYSHAYTHAYAHVQGAYTTCLHACLHACHSDGSSLVITGVSTLTKTLDGLPSATAWPMGGFGSSSGPAAQRIELSLTQSACVCVCMQACMRAGGHTSVRLVCCVWWHLAALGLADPHLGSRIGHAEVEPRDLGAMCA